MTFFTICYLYDVFCSLALQTLYPKSKGKESGDLHSPNLFHLMNIIMVLLTVISEAWQLVTTVVLSKGPHIPPEPVWYE